MTDLIVSDLKENFFLEELKKMQLNEKTDNFFKPIPYIYTIVSEGIPKEINSALKLKLSKFV